MAGKHLANQITVVRIILVFIFAVLLVYGNNFIKDFKGSAIATAGMVLFVIAIFALDWVDGYLARKHDLSTDFGSMFDIVGDRIVELVLLISFAYLSLISILIPILFIIRGQITDMFRFYFLKAGKTPFGEKSMHKKGSISYFITSSRFMRGFYGLLKMALFILGTFVFLYTSHNMQYLSLVYWLGWATLAVNILRGIPPIVDGAKNLDKVMEK